jgi:GxxExxY protein
MDRDDISRNRMSNYVIGCTFNVMNTLGCGFFENVYENALVHDLRKVGLRVAQQHGITVRDDDSIVGEYTADELVEDAIVVELKVTKTLNNVHAAQCIN